MERQVSIAALGIGQLSSVVNDAVVEIKEIRASRPEIETQVQKYMEKMPPHCKPLIHTPVRQYIP